MGFNFMTHLSTMATRWSSEFTVTEHKDLQASAMAVDCTGLYALLAGRRYLAIKNLTDASDTLHKVSHQSKYEVGTAEWNPSLLNKDLCAITTRVCNGFKGNPTLPGPIRNTACSPYGKVTHHSCTEIGTSSDTGSVPVKIFKTKMAAHL